MDGQTITGNNNEGDNITKTKIVNHGWGTRPNKTTSITLAFSKTRIQNPLGDAGPNSSAVMKLKAKTK